MVVAGQATEKTLNTETLKPDPLRVVKSGEIADPVHRYIRFTSIEREIIDHRVTQRLRYIAQAGLAQFVYPEVRTSRFSHSLGVMHLASRFLSTSLRNASKEVRKQLFKGFNEALKKASGRFGGSVGQIAKTLESEPLETGADIGGSECPGIRLVEQGLRLAALFHDLGHLPFSHDFETAIEEYGRERNVRAEGPMLPVELFEQETSAGKLHERLGRRLSELLLFEVIDSIPFEKQSATKIVFDLAQQIFDSTSLPNPTPEEDAILWLHTLIDGEIDVDRCDYILRDGRNYAFEFATLDLPRLLGNLVAAADDNGRFVLAILPHGLSAVEDFLLARSRSYQHGVRHHKVAQAGAALQHCIKTIIKNPRTSDRYEQFIEDLSYLARAGSIGEEHDEFLARFEENREERREFLDRFAAYDDVWWTGVMRAYQKRDEWFELVCWRKSGPTTLWKWLGDFPDKENISAWNSRLPGKRDEDEAADWFAEKLQLEQEGVIILRHKFCPWEAEDDKANAEESKLCVLMKDGKLQPVTQLSRLVKDLPAAWMEEIQVQAFKRSDCKVTADDVYERLGAVMKKEKVVANEEKEAEIDG